MAKLWRAAVATAAVAWAGCASADPADRVLRVTGHAPAAKDPAPAEFVIDAVVKPGDGPLQSTVDGWFAALPPAMGSGEIEGNCADSHCALSVDLEDGKLAVTGDLAGPGAPGAGRLVFKSDEDDTEHPEGAVTFSPISGDVPGLGSLAPPGAVSSNDLIELLLWNGSSADFGNSGDDDPPGSFQRDALADWQTANGRPGTGLILASDLQAMRAKMEADKAADGWKKIGDDAAGWSTGYPAKLLPKASQSGREHRFESADGKAVLVVALDPPLSDDAFDALFEDLKADKPNRDGLGYSRVNGEAEIRWRENGLVTASTYRNVQGGLMRVIYTYPDGDETFEPFAAITAHSLRLSDKLTGR